MCNLKEGDRIVCNRHSPHNGKHGTIIGKQSPCCYRITGECCSVFDVKLDDGQRVYVYSYKLGFEGSTQQAPAAPDFSPLKVGDMLKLLHTNKSRVECTCKSLLYGCICGAGRAEMTATNPTIDPMVDFFKSSTKEWKSKHG